MKTRFRSIPTAREVNGVALCLSQEEFEKASEILNIPSTEAYSVPGGAKAWTMLNDRRQVFALVCLSEELQKSPQHIVHGMLAHEAVHVWQDFRDSIGEEAPGVEQEAYAIGNICESLFKEYDRRTRSRKKSR